MNVESLAFGSDVEALLTRCGLPSSDAGAPGVRLYGTRRDGQWVGVVGLELYGDVGLLRSLAVEEHERHGGLGRLLVTHAESEAAAHGVQRLFLLTTTAADFFARLGYVHEARSSAAAAIAATSQFASLCPATAVFMSKALAVTRTP